MNPHLKQLLDAVNGMPPQHVIRGSGVYGNDAIAAAQLRRLALTDSVTGLASNQAVAIRIGTLLDSGIDPTAVDPDLPPDASPDRCLLMTPEQLRELCAAPLPIQVAETPPKPAELPEPLVLCSDPIDPDQE
jgi:hypothetical protein